MARRYYTEDDKATALAYLEANRGNVRVTAKQVGIPFQTLQYWAKGGAIRPNMTELSVIKKESLRERWESLAYQALEAAKNLSEEASYKDLVMAAAIATDKSQALADRENAEQAVTEERFLQVVGTLRGLLDQYVTDTDTRAVIASQFAAITEAGHADAGAGVPAGSEAG
jgi:hypothetical protein